jgi:hypothetical protein
MEGKFLLPARSRGSRDRGRQLTAFAKLPELLRKPQAQ